MNPIPIWNTPIPSQICANPRLSVLNQGFWGCIKRREFKQMHPSHGQVRANIVQLNMAHIKLEPMISGFISPEHHPRNRNWLQPPWSSQVPFVKDVGISSDILLQNLQTNSTVSFRKAQPNRWVFFNSCTPQWSPGTLTKLDCMFMNWSYLGWSVKQLPSSTNAGKSPKDLWYLWWFFWHFRWLAVNHLSRVFFFLGWTVEPLVFLLRKPGEPWGTPCEISNMSFGDAGWQGASPKTPRTWYVPHDLMMGCTYGVRKKRDCECLWMLWPVTHMAMAHTHVIRRGFLRESPSTLQTCSTAEDAQCIFPNGSMETFIVGCTVDEFAAQILGGMSLRLPVGVDCSFRQTRRHLMSYPPGI